MVLVSIACFQQNALEIYRKDQESHHEQSIASDLTRGLLRKVFRDTVLESSKQVPRSQRHGFVWQITNSLFTPLDI